MDEVELQRRASLVLRLREGSLVLFDAPRMMREVAAKKGQNYKALLQKSKTAYDAMVRQKSMQLAEVDLGKYCVWMSDMNCAHHDYIAKVAQHLQERQ